MDVNAIIRQVMGAGKVVPQRSIYTETWLSWYRGDVIGFHNYRIYNGNQHLELRRKTLQMAKQVCETWANLLLNEKCDIVVPDAAKEPLDKILTDNNFWMIGNEGIELSWALGLGALLVNVDGFAVGERTGKIDKSKAHVSIDFVDALKIHPITVVNKRVTECAFVSENSDSTVVVVHKLNDRGHYEIHSYKTSQKGDVIASHQFDTKSNKPWFFILRPNIANNLKTMTSDRELGISIFANSIDTLKAIDNKYDGFDMEFVLGRKRLFLSTEAWNMRPAENGGTTSVHTFDPYDQLFYHLPENQDGKSLVTDQSGLLRHESYIQGLNSELHMLSMKCGLGESYYKFNGGATMTATQVISENSSLFRNIKRHEILLEQVLRSLTETVAYAAREFTNVNFPELDSEDITIVFDDSIIEDRNAEMERDRSDVVAGLMAKHEYRMKWYGEDEDTALENITKYFLYDRIDRYMNAVVTGVMTPDQYVDTVYPDAKNRDEIVKYIEEFVGSAPQDSNLDMYDGDEGRFESDEDDELKDDEE